MQKYRKMHEGVLILSSCINLIHWPPGTKVCRAIQERIKNSAYLSYLIDLEVSGYVKNPTFKLPLRESNLLLAEKVRYWKNIDWTRPIVYDVLDVEHAGGEIYTRGIILISLTPEVTVSQQGVSRQYEVLQPSDPKNDIKRPTLQADRLLEFDPGQNLAISMSYIGWENDYFLIWFGSSETHLVK